MIKHTMRQKKDHIAIIGAGFSGLAAAYYLSKKGHPITIYDPAPIGENASGISAGLLHYYTGPRASPPKDADLKLNSTVELLNASSLALGEPVFTKSGLFRPALNEEQEANYRKRADEDPDVRWMTADEVHKHCPTLRQLPGIWIHNGYRIDTKLYLKGLWSACESTGGKWVSKAISSVGELDEDQVLVTTGACQIEETKDLPIHPIKGQILEIEWENTLPFPISANIYFVPGKSPNHCYIGGTFEHHFSSTLPDEKTAKELLMPKIGNLFPQINKISVLGVRAALRASTPDRLPILQKIDRRTTVLVGMGSKGLLNHAFYAKKLINY